MLIVRWKNGEPNSGYEKWTGKKWVACTMKEIIKAKSGSISWNPERVD